MQTNRVKFTQDNKNMYYSRSLKVYRTLQIVLVNAVDENVLGIPSNKKSVTRDKKESLLTTVAGRLLLLSFIVRTSLYPI